MRALKDESRQIHSGCPGLISIEEIQIHPVEVQSVYKGNPGLDLEPDFLGVSRTPKLENLGVRQKIWECAIFLKYNIIYS